LPKLKAGEKLSVGIDFHVSIETGRVANLKSELKQIVDDLGLTNEIKIEEL